MGKGDKKTKLEAFKTETLKKATLKTVRYDPNVHHSPTSDEIRTSELNGVCRDHPTAQCSIGHSKTHILTHNDADNAFYTSKNFSDERENSSSEFNSKGNLKNPPYDSITKKNTKSNERNIQKRSSRKTGGKSKRGTRRKNRI